MCILILSLACLFPSFSPQDDSSVLTVEPVTGVLTYMYSSTLTSSHTVTATATDTMLSATVAVTVSVIADGTAPKFSKLFYDVSVTEDTAVGTVLMMLQVEGNMLDVVYQIQTNNQVSTCICKKISKFLQKKLW